MLKKKYYEPEFELERIYLTNDLLKSSYGEGEINEGSDDGDDILQGTGVDNS